MTVETLKDLYSIRCEIEKIGECHEIGGREISIEFLCNFGYMGRAARHTIEVDGKFVGLMEVFVPWNIFKETVFLYILDSVILDSPPENWGNCESPYSDPIKYHPSCSTLEDFISMMKEYNC